MQLACTNWSARWHAGNERMDPLNGTQTLNIEKLPAGRRMASKGQCIQVRGNLWELRCGWMDCFLAWARIGLPLLGPLRIDPCGGTKLIEFTVQFSSNDTRIAVTCFRCRHRQRRAPAGRAEAGLFIKTTSNQALISVRRTKPLQAGPP